MTASSSAPAGAMSRLLSSTMTGAGAASTATSAAGTGSCTSAAAGAAALLSADAGVLLLLLPCLAVRLSHLLLLEPSAATAIAPTAAPAGTATTIMPAQESTHMHAAVQESCWGVMERV